MRLFSTLTLLLGFFCFLGFGLSAQSPAPILSLQNNALEDTIVHLTFQQSLIDTCGETGWDGQYILQLDIFPESIATDSFFVQIVLFEYLEYSLIDTGFFEQWYIGENTILTDPLIFIHPCQYEAYGIIDVMELTISDSNGNILYNQFLDSYYGYFQEGLPGQVISYDAPFLENIGDLFYLEADTLNICQYQSWEVGPYCYFNLCNSLNYCCENFNFVLLEDTNAIEIYQDWMGNFFFEPEQPDEVLAISLDGTFPTLPNIENDDNLILLPVLFSSFGDYNIKEVFDPIPVIVQEEGCEPAVYLTFQQNLIDTCGQTDWWDKRHIVNLDIVPESLSNDSIFIELNFYEDPFSDFSFNLIEEFSQWTINETSINTPPLKYWSPCALEGYDKTQLITINITNNLGDLIYTNEFNFTDLDVDWNLISLPPYDDGPYGNIINIEADTITACKYQSWDVGDFCYFDVCNAYYEYEQIELQGNTLFALFDSSLFEIDPYIIDNWVYDCDFYDCSLLQEVAISVSFDGNFPPLPDLESYDDLMILPIHQPSNWGYGIYIEIFDPIPVILDSEITLDSLETEIICLTEEGISIELNDSLLVLEEVGDYYPLQVTGCNSASVRHYQVVDVEETFNSWQICMGYGLQLGDTTLIYPAPGTYEYIQNLPSQFGCDSVVIHSIEALPSYFYFLPNIQLCTNEAVEVGDSILTFQESGNYQYIQQLTTQFGCDSTIVQDFVVNEANEQNLPLIEICVNQEFVINDNVWIYEEAGNYQDTLYLTNQLGCDSLIVQNIVVYDELIVQINNGLDSLELTDGMGMLSVEGDFVSFLWEPNGETNANISVNESGLYSVTATDDNGCSATAAVYVNVYMVGIEELVQDNGIRVFPNPSNDFLILENVPETLEEFVLFNQWGQKVKVFEGNIRRLEVGDLPVGAYFLLGNFGDNFWVERVLIF